MNRILFIIVFVIIGMPLIGQPQFHSLNTTFTTGVNGPMLIGKTSIMYSGIIAPNYIQARELADKKDGEVRYRANAVLSSNEKVILCLEDNDTNKQYRIELKNSEYYIVEEANNIEIPMGSYEDGDEFIVERCGFMIMYRHDGVLKKYTVLENNEFTMDGRVDVNLALGANAHIEFEQTN